MKSIFNDYRNSISQMHFVLDQRIQYENDINVWSKKDTDYYYQLSEAIRNIME